MNDQSQQRIAALLSETGAAHGVYEEGELNGVYDQNWPAWYAAYLVEHGLGDLMGGSVTIEQISQLLKQYDQDYRHEQPRESWPAYYAHRLVVQFGTDQSHKGGAIMNIEANKAIVRRYFEEVFNGKQPGLVGELFASDAIYTLAGLPQPLQGPAAIQGAAAGFLAGVPDLQMKIESLIAEADQVAVRYTGRGTHQGDLMGISPTGNHIILPGIAVYRVAEGKIVAGWDSADIVGLLAQLGALPMAAQA
jgi:ketosteroid isomerase-like protein